MLGKKRDVKYLLVIYKTKAELRLKPFILIEKSEEKDRVFLAECIYFIVLFSYVLNYTQYQGCIL